MKTKNTTQRLYEYLNYKGINNNQITKKANLSVGLIGNALKKNTGINSETIEKILYVCSDLNPEWLLTGKGEMLKNNVKTEVEAEKTPTAAGKKSIPLLPFEAFAGYGDPTITGVNFDVIEERYVVPLFEGITIDFMLSVRGSSMYPKYSSGDVVACRIVNELLFVQWNKVYIIDSVTQGILMKRLLLSNKETHIICRSDNKDYPDFEVPKEDIRNIALVVGVIRLE